MDATEHTIQDAFLNAVRRDHAPVTVYLVNGIRLIGRIRGFDKYSILFDAGQHEMLIFKHAISTIAIAKAAEPRTTEASGASQRVEGRSGTPAVAPQ